MEGTEEIIETSKASPEQIRIVIITCMFLLAMIVIFMGFAYGSARVCNQVDGFLDSKFKCHLDYNKPKQIVPETPSFLIPNFTLRPE